MRLASSIVVLAALGVAIGVTSCRGSGPTVSPGEKGNYAGVAESDPEINAAIERARRELDTFIARLQHPKPREDFGLKVGLPADDGSKEHIWVSGLSFSNGQFSGFLANDPFLMKSLKLGSPVTVTRDQVTDWQIYQNGSPTEGGYTTAILEKREGAK